MPWSHNEMKFISLESSRWKIDDEGIINMIRGGGKRKLW